MGGAMGGTAGSAAPWTPRMTPWPEDKPTAEDNITPGGNMTPGVTMTPGGNMTPGVTMTPGGNMNSGGNMTPGGNLTPGGGADSRQRDITSPSSSGAPSSTIKPALKQPAVTSPAPPKPPRILLSEDTFQMITRGDTFYTGNNFLGIRRSRHYFVDADLKWIGWRRGAQAGQEPNNANRVPFEIFEKVTYDDSQSKRGLYVIAMVGRKRGYSRKGSTDDEETVLEYQTPNAVRANKWYMALSFCVDKACGRI